MPFGWRNFIPYGLGRLIPQPTAQPSAPAAPAGINPNTGFPGSGSGPGEQSGGGMGWTSSGGSDPSTPYGGSGWQASAANPAQPTSAPTVNPYYNPYGGDMGGSNPFGSPVQMGPGVTMGPGSAYAPPAAPTAGPSGGMFGNIGATISHAFAPGGVFGDAPNMGRINTGGYGGQFGGVAPWSAAGVAAGAAGQNPGSTGYVAIPNQEIPATSKGYAL